MFLILCPTCLKSSSAMLSFCPIFPKCCVLLCTLKNRPTSLSLPRRFLLLNYLAQIFNFSCEVVYILLWHQTTPASIIPKHFDGDSFIALSTLHCNGLSLPHGHFYIVSTKHNSWYIVNVTWINKRHEAKAWNQVF